MDPYYDMIIIDQVEGEGMAGAIFRTGCRDISSCASFACCSLSPSREASARPDGCST